MGLRKILDDSSYVDEVLSKKLLKKTKVIYSVLRKGESLFQYNDDIKIKYKYLLDNDYDVSFRKIRINEETSGIHVVVTFDHMTIKFEDMPDNAFLPKDMSRWKLTLIGAIEKKFSPFGIRLGVPMTVTNIT